MGVSFDKLPSTSSLRQAPFDKLPSTSSGPSTSSLRQAPFDKLPSTSSLRQAPFDKLPSTSSLRQAQGERQAPFDKLPSTSSGRTIYWFTYPSQLLQGDGNFGRKARGQPKKNRLIISRTSSLEMMPSKKSWMAWMTSSWEIISSWSAS